MARVVGDLEDPARELVFGPVAVDRVEHLDEGFLREVLGELAIAHHAIDQREDRPLVAADQLAIRGLTSARRVADHFLVGEGAPFDGVGLAACGLGWS